MNFLTRYRIKKFIKEDTISVEKKGLVKRIKPILKYGLISPTRFMFMKFAEWLNKQHKGTVLLVILAILLFGFFVLNQLRYNYWVNIMRTNYPNDVLVAVDKVLFEWNSRVKTTFFLMFSMLQMIFLAIVNHMYNSDEPQTIPGTFKIK